MKTLSYILTLFILLISVQSYSQTPAVKSASFKVSGNCDLCKSRIEKAAKIDGVAKADWNMKTKIITITYNPAKTNPDNIQKKIAGSGHDTEKYKADDKSYNALPSCCQYR